MFFKKDYGIFKEDEADVPLIRDQQASEVVLQYIVDALNEKWERENGQPRPKLQTHPKPTGHGRPLAHE